MRTVASEIETAEASGQVHHKARVLSARRLRLRRMALEGLEERTLLSTLPAATPGTAVDISNEQGNESSPQIVVDR
jgi:hypothetical protein